MEKQEIKKVHTTKSYSTYRMYTEELVKSIEEAGELKISKVLELTHQLLNQYRAYGTARNASAASTAIALLKLELAEVEKCPIDEVPLKMHDWRAPLARRRLRTGW